ncbi:MAG TPA: HYR domain-containing protein [Planctomycetota bacterium]
MLSPAGLALLASGAIALSTAPSESAKSEESRQEVTVVAESPLVLEGCVLAPDGAPAQGAVVVSSAGGQAVTDVRGRYRLAVALAPEVAGLQVTAVGAGSGGLVASARVARAGAAVDLRVPPLHLARGSGCVPSWLPTFGGMLGVQATVRAMVVHDDGGGPALHVGGDFTSAGGVQASHIARWNGTSWAALGSGTSGPVHALLSFDDGSGPALFAGGAFTSAGGEPANRVARWNGMDWSALGAGRNGPVHALAVHDDGSGPALHVAGNFTDGVARWNGASWTALGLGFGLQGQDVLALAAFDDGTGEALYVGGSFTLPTSRIARWDGASWTALGSGTNGTVRALLVHDDGTGPALVVGGDFGLAGGTPALGLARWDGASWTSIGNGAGLVRSLAVHDDGSGPALYAGGFFAGFVNGVARWDGANLTVLGSFSHNTVHALASFDAGPGAELFAGGFIATVDDEIMNHVTRWNGVRWSTLGSGLDAGIEALAVHDDGTGPALFAAGFVLAAGGQPVGRIARWDGVDWSPLGSGTNGLVQALVVHDDGSGPALYAGGQFSSAGGVGTSRIARWDGTSWGALGSGTNAAVFALASHDDGSGPALFAAGGFTSAGGVTVNRVARWNGAGWAALGGGMDGTVRCLTTHDDGSGPALYAGGNFTIAGGMSASRIARWNGTSWAPVGGGILDLSVNALAEFDEGSGPRLFAAGGFSSAGGQPIGKIARWDGVTWSALGSGLDAGASIQALLVHDDGGGPALYVGGGLSSAGGLAVSGLARWDGSAWAPVGSGVLGGSIEALASFDDGGGPALYAGGSFTSAPDSEDSFLAKWGCPDSVPPVLDCPSEVRVHDRGFDGEEVVSFTVGVFDGVDPAPVLVCVPPSGSVFPLGSTLVTCTATDALGNQSTCEFPVTVEPKARRR